MELQRITGSVQVDNRARGRVYVAAFITAEGSKTRRVLGPAHVKDSGKRTPKGAVAWRTADGPKPSDQHVTPKDAQDSLAAILRDEEEKRRRVGAVAVRTTGRTFGDALATYLLRCERDGKAATTLRGYRSIAAGLRAEFGEATTLRRVDARRVQEFRDALLDGPLSPARHERIWQLLSATMKHAARQGWITHNPVAEVDRPPRPKASGDFVLLSAEEVEAIARAAETGSTPLGPQARKAHAEDRIVAYNLERERWAAQLGAMVRVAAQTGLRMGELRALRWADLDFANQLVHVRRNDPQGGVEKAPKSGRVRSVPMIDAAARALDALSQRGSFTAPADLVFPAGGGGRFDGGKVLRDFKSATVRAGLGHRLEKRPGHEPLTFHDLRHVFGSMAVRTQTLTDVQAWMGHANVQTTMRYIHYVPRPEAQRRLSAAWESGPLPTVATVA